MQVYWKFHYHSLNALGVMKYKAEGGGGGESLPPWPQKSRPTKISSIKIDLKVNDLFDFY